MSNHAASMRLISAIRDGRAPHAVLLTGPEGCGLNDIARKAAAVHCVGAEDVSRLETCPDYFELGPEPVPIDAIRELVLAVAERSFSGRRAVVFVGAHSMKAPAQNALLKTLEEPPAGTLFLLTGQEAGLLPTIRSRCSVLRFGAYTNEETKQKLIEAGIEPELAGLCAWLSDGAPELALTYATKEHAAFFTQAAELFFLAASDDIPPYAKLKALLDTDINTDQGAKSKSAKQRPAAELCIRVWLAILMDMLEAKYKSCPAPANPIAARAAKEAERFTIRRIQGMIEKALSAKMRISAASPSLAMEALITDFA